MCIRDSNINILGLNMNKKISWKPHITTVARAASKNWKFCLDCETFLLFSVAAAIQGSHPPMYVVLLSYLGGGGALISPCFWTGSSQRPKRLINCFVLSSSLDPLSLRRDVGALSLSYRYRSGKCSRELITRVPPPLRPLRSTNGAVSAHEYCVDIGNSRLVCCGAC